MNTKNEKVNKYEGWSFISLILQMIGFLCIYNYIGMYNVYTSYTIIEVKKKKNIQDNVLIDDHQN